MAVSDIKIKSTNFLKGKAEDLKDLAEQFRPYIIGNYVERCRLVPGLPNKTYNREVICVKALKDYKYNNFAFRWIAKKRRGTDLQITVFMEDNTGTQYIRFQKYYKDWETLRDDFEKFLSIFDQMDPIRAAEVKRQKAEEEKKKKAEEEKKDNGGN